MKLITTISIILTFFTTSIFASTKIKMETSKGDIILELDEVKAPISVKNFLSYVDKKYYDGLIFHRVIPGFMIQGGGFKPGMNMMKTDKSIKNEANNGLKNTIGTIAMARTSEVNSATSQFFINVNDNESLNHRSMNSRGFGYAVFGKVTKGMSVINKIKKVQTGNKKGYGDVPLEDVIIKKVSRM
jgi:cyclophilin family peptidyl-prolyl cis-trans isomerase